MARQHDARSVDGGNAVGRVHDVVDETVQVEALPDRRCEARVFGLAWRGQHEWLHLAAVDQTFDERAEVFAAAA